MPKRRKEFEVENPAPKRRDILSSVTQVHRLIQNVEVPVVMVGVEDLQNLLVASVLWLETTK